MNAEKHLPCEQFFLSVEEDRVHKIRPFHSFHTLTNRYNFAHCREHQPTRKLRLNQPQTKCTRLCCFLPQPFSLGVERELVVTWSLAMPNRRNSRRFVRHRPRSLILEGQNHLARNAQGVDMAPINVLKGHRALFDGISQHRGMTHSDVHCPAWGCILVVL